MMEYYITQYLKKSSVYIKETVKQKREAVC